MDEIELLVEETFRHYDEQFSALEEAGAPLGMREFQETTPVEPAFVEEQRELLPMAPGVIYHIQKSKTVFVVRTFISDNIRRDHTLILLKPEDYPSLRLLEDGVDELDEKVRFFLVDNIGHAEIIHDQINNRRFPVNEEMMCNISDPGFSWWLTPKDRGFQLSFNLAVTPDDGPVKLGPLGNQQVALRNFQLLESILTDSGLALSMQNEQNRVFFTEGEDFVLEELKELFEYGVVSDTIHQLFKMLSRTTQDISSLQSAWFYIQELAAMRRFWMQVQYDLTQV